MNSGVQCDISRNITHLILIYIATSNWIILLAVNICACFLILRGWEVGFHCIWTKISYLTIRQTVLMEYAGPYNYLRSTDQSLLSISDCQLAPMECFQLLPPTVEPLTPHCQVFSSFNIIRINIFSSYSLCPV